MLTLVPRPLAVVDTLPRGIKPLSLPARSLRVALFDYAAAEDAAGRHSQAQAAVEAAQSVAGGGPCAPHWLDALADAFEAGGKRAMAAAARQVAHEYTATGEPTA